MRTTDRAHDRGNPCVRQHAREKKSREREESERERGKRERREERERGEQRGRACARRQCTSRRVAMARDARQRERVCGCGGTVEEVVGVLRPRAAVGRRVLGQILPLLLDALLRGHGGGGRAGEGGEGGRGLDEGGMERAASHRRSITHRHTAARRRRRAPQNTGVRPTAITQLLRCTLR